MNWTFAEFLQYNIMTLQKGLDEQRTTIDAVMIPDDIAILLLPNYRSAKEQQFLYQAALQIYNIWRGQNAVDVPAGSTDPSPEAVDVYNVDKRAD